MLKNPSARGISIISAICIAGILAITLFIFHMDAKIVWVASLSTLFVSFTIFYLLIHLFIQRKIELIYRNIYRFKAQDEKFLSTLTAVKKDPVQAVSDDVLSWMTDNKKEILELKEQAKFRREFIGNLSHELKTPIFSAQGYVHTLLDGAIHDDQVNVKFLKKAARAIDRLVLLVNDINEISKLQSGNNAPVPEKFDLELLVNEVFDLLDSQAKEREIRLKFRSHSRSNFVNADRKQIFHVLQNLVVNAINYGRSAGYVEVVCNEIGNDLVVEVIDDGEGIAEEHLSRLFERFYRVDRHRSRDVGGSGLGLSIVKHIVESHGKTINVRSTLGEGTVFVFTLAKA